MPALAPTVLELGLHAIWLTFAGVALCVLVTLQLLANVTAVLLNFSLFLVKLGL